MRWPCSSTLVFCARADGVSSTPFNHTFRVVVLSGHFSCVSSENLVAYQDEST